MQEVVLAKYSASHRSLAIQERTPAGNLASGFAVSGFGVFVAPDMAPAAAYALRAIRASR